MRRRSALSVRCRRLNRIDHNQFDGAPCWFELQSELLPKGGKDRGIVGHAWHCVKRREHQRESEHAREAGLIDDWPIKTPAGLTLTALAIALVVAILFILSLLMLALKA